MGSQAVLKVFLFTDLVDSTLLKQRLGDVEGSRIIGRHDELFRRCLHRFHGREEDNPGDGFFATFDLPSEAVRCALAFVKALHETDAAERLRVRIGIHMGETTRLETADAPRPKLMGLAVDMTARVMSLALPEQILLTRHAFDSVRQHVTETPDGSPVAWRAHGRYAFKGVEEPQEVFEVGVESVSPMTPPPDSEKVHRVLTPGDEETLGWRPAVGRTVPGRPGWTLEGSLGAGAFGEVWVARHERTRDSRAFKFCYEPQHLRALKRELTLFRLMKESLGERSDIAKLYEVRLNKPPFFLEMEYTNGGDLGKWAEDQGGIGSIPLKTRLKLIVGVADALDAAHSVGIIHKDVSPANVLIHQPKKGEPEVRLTDFGIGQIVSTTTLKQSDITVTGFGASQETLTNLNAQTGTQLYMAPELFEGKPPTCVHDANLAIAVRTWLSGRFFGIISAAARL